MAWGTLSVADLQATLNNTTVADFGLDDAFRAISNTLASHNRLLAEMIADLVDPTTDTLRRTGGTDSMTMEDADEFSRPHPQKVTAGANLGFPLNLAMIGLQWNRKWFQNHSAQELAAQTIAAMSADRSRVMRDIKRAWYLVGNYTHNDHLVDKIDIPVKRLANADSFPIPPGPNNEAFTASSHTHYLARVSTFAATDLDALIDTVREHYESGEIAVYINKAQEAAVRAFTGFVAFVDARIIQATDVTHIDVPGLNISNTYNREIGIYNGAVIKVKPWVPANYLTARNLSAQKPLAMRTRTPTSGGFEITFEDDIHPLHAKGFEREFGVGTQNRISSAHLYVGGTTWADPTIT